MSDFSTSNEARHQALAHARKTTSEVALKLAKERRFSLSASMLTNKSIAVRVENDPSLPMACIDIHKNTMMLNEGDKRLDWSNPITALINTRSSLFHEVDHSLFTRDDNGKVRQLSERAKDAHAFDLLRNILEDGRIETLGKLKFAGQADFFNATLLEMVKTLGKTPFDGLHLYVRTGMFRNESEAKFWQPYKTQIDKAIHANSTSKMLDIAFSIAEALSESKPKQGEQKQGGEKGEQGGASAPEQDDKREESGEESESAGEDSSDESGEGESGDSDESESEGGDESGEGKTSSQGAGAGDSKPRKPDELSKETFDKLTKLVKQAKQRCEAEAESDLAAIVAEAESYEPEQEYNNEGEQIASDELSSTFTSLLVESVRSRYYGSRAGLLNQATLANALTSRKCFHKREETPQTPHVALLLDVSGSMNMRMDALSHAARVINGALRKAKVDTLTLTFGGHDGMGYGEEAFCLNGFKTIPADQPLVSHGGTPTHMATSAANDWLESNAATRGLIIVATDGSPNSLAQAQAQLTRAEQNGAFVIGVLLGMEASSYDGHPERLNSVTSQFNASAFCPKVEALAEVLAPMLTEYLAQG